MTYPVHMESSNIPFFSSQAINHTLRTEMLTAMMRVYDSQWYVLGEELIQFEQEYSHFNKTLYTIGVGNGLEALSLSLQALGITKGDEVLVPSNTYIATWLAVTQLGAVPVPIEPDPATSNIDPTRLADGLTNRTRAVIPVHLYGQACRMPEIMAFAQQHNLYVVEDNAQAHGASFAGQLTGSFGHANATSFYPTKNLGALGDAGAITTNDPFLVTQLQMLRNYGSVTKYVHEIIGRNSRLDELQAALLRIKLRYLREWIVQRQQLARYYQEELADIAELRLPTIADGATHVYHLYVVHAARRNSLQQYLATRGISTLIHYPVPPHQQPAYVRLEQRVAHLPIAEELAATCLSLPLWPGMTRVQVRLVARAIAEFYAR